MLLIGSAYVAGVVIAYGINKYVDDLLLQREANRIREDVGLPVQPLKIIRRKS